MKTANKYTTLKLGANISVAGSLRLTYFLTQSYIKSALTKDFMPSILSYFDVCCYLGQIPVFNLLQILVPLCAIICMHCQHY